MDKTINYHKFIDDELSNFGMRIQVITEEILKENLRKFSKFINDSFGEYYDIYKWRKHADDEYLLNPLKDKFKYSYVIFDNDNFIKFVCFASVVDDKISNHFLFTSKDSRNKNLAKYHTIKLSLVGLENGYKETIGYFSKKNNGSLILFLRMGFEISHIREDDLIIAYGNHEKVIDNVYNMLMKDKLKK